MAETLQVHTLLAMTVVQGWAYTNVYTASGTKLKQQFLYYDANIEFFCMNTCY